MQEVILGKQVADDGVIVIEPVLMLVTRLTGPCASVDTIGSLRERSRRRRLKVGGSLSQLFGEMDMMSRHIQQSSIQLTCGYHTLRSPARLNGQLIRPHPGSPLSPARPAGLASGRGHSPAGATDAIGDASRWPSLASEARRMCWSGGGGALRRFAGEQEIVIEAAETIRTQHSSPDSMASVDVGIGVTKAIQVIRLRHSRLEDVQVLVEFVRFLVRSGHWGG
nr:unnamed protein product [Spirometra erinaceieuropaei]